jgi:hypothetical protein
LSPKLADKSKPDNCNSFSQGSPGNIDGKVELFCWCCRA